MVRRGPNRPDACYCVGRRNFRPTRLLAAVFTTALFVGALFAPAAPVRAESRPIKNIVLVDLATKKKVWLKQAFLSTYKVHLSERYFPDLKSHFGELTLVTLSIQPVLGFAPREYATTEKDPRFGGKSFFVVPLEPKPCDLKLIRNPPIKDYKDLKPEQKLDAEMAFYQYAAAACATTGDTALKVAIDMFRAKTLKDACEKEAMFTCGDALELYDRIRLDLKGGRLTAADFKKGGVSQRLIRARVAQLLHRALEQGMRFYVRNRNKTDRRAVLGYLARIVAHPMVASSTKAQAERGRKTVIGDWCRVDPKGCKSRNAGAAEKRNGGTNEPRRLGKPG